MKHGVDILVATPGRLLDLVKQQHIRLDGVSTLIVDEADRMLDMGFIRDVRKIVSMLPKQRQSMLFSATMPDDVVKLVGDMLHQPERDRGLASSQTADRIEPARDPRPDKGQARTSLASSQGRRCKRVHRFHAHQAHRQSGVRASGKYGISADAIHGNKSQNARQRALDNFKSGQVRVLVATDIAARGIDVDDISHVINFELPNEPESYVHRIGRTARAGTEGIAISFCDPSERGYLRDIERLVKRQIAVITHDLPAGSLAPANANEERRPHRPNERNYKNPKRRFNPRGNRRAA